MAESTNEIGSVGSTLRGCMCASEYDECAPEAESLRFDDVSVTGVSLLVIPTTDRVHSYVD